MLVADVLLASFKRKYGGDLDFIRLEAQTRSNPVSNSSILRQSHCLSKLAAIPDCTCDDIYCDDFNHKYAEP